jgi:hypothetical protein
MKGELNSPKRRPVGKGPLISTQDARRECARHVAATLNEVLAATYWKIGGRDGRDKAARRTMRLERSLGGAGGGAR